MTNVIELKYQNWGYNSYYQPWHFYPQQYYQAPTISQHLRHRWIEQLENTVEDFGWELLESVLSMWIKHHTIKCLGTQNTWSCFFFFLKKSKIVWWVALFISCILHPNHTFPSFLFPQPSTLPPLSPRFISPRLITLQKRADLPWKSVTP